MSSIKNEQLGVLINQFVKCFKNNLRKLQIVVACKIKYLLLTAKILFTTQLHENA